MARTEIREVNGYKVGFNLDTKSYYPIGDRQFDPNYGQASVVPELLGAVIEAPATLGEAITPSLEYSSEPNELPVLTFQWQEGNSPVSTFADIPGATTESYVPECGGKFVKVIVTAVRGATGSVMSNAKKVPMGG